MKKTIVSVQTRGNPGQVQANLKKTQMIVEGCSIPFDFIIFPELFGTGYTWNQSLKGLIKNKQAEIESWLKALSENNSCSVIAGMGRWDGKNYYNSTVLFDNGQRIDYYDKTHLFRGEKDLFKSGQRFKTYELSGVKTGIVMCYEIGIPEISRIAALNGAQILFMPFAFGKSRRVNYDTLTKARAIENGCYVCTSSTPGAHEGFDFLGHSRIISPSGEILCDALEKEGWIAAEYDSELVEKFRYTEDEISSGYYKNYRSELFES